MLTNAQLNWFLRRKGVDEDLRKILVAGGIPAVWNELHITWIYRLLDVVEGVAALRTEMVFIAADRAVRVHVPRALRVCDFEAQASVLEALAPLRDSASTAFTVEALCRVAAEVRDALGVLETSEPQTSAAYYKRRAVRSLDYGLAELLKQFPFGAETTPRRAWDAVNNRVAVTAHVCEDERAPLRNDGVVQDVKFRESRVFAAMVREKLSVDALTAAIEIDYEREQSSWAEDSPRAFRAADLAVRSVIADALQSAGLHAEAARFRALDPITDKASVLRAENLCVRIWNELVETGRHPSTLARVARGRVYHVSRPYEEQRRSEKLPASIAIEAIKLAEAAAAQAPLALREKSDPSLTEAEWWLAKTRRAITGAE